MPTPVYSYEQNAKTQLLNACPNGKEKITQFFDTIDEFTGGQSLVSAFKNNSVEVQSLSDGTAEYEADITGGLRIFFDIDKTKNQFKNFKIVHTEKRKKIIFSVS